MVTAVLRTKASSAASSFPTAPGENSPAIRSASGGVEAIRRARRTAARRHPQMRQISRESIHTDC